MLPASQNIDTSKETIIHPKLLVYYACVECRMCNATPVLPFKTRRPTRHHYFLRVNFRPFSFFTRTTRAKINPGCNNKWSIRAFSIQLTVSASVLKDVIKITHLR